MSKLKPKKQYTIQTTVYRGGHLVKSTTVSYPVKWVNRHNLIEVINNMTSLKNNENKA
ncbi:MAG: hypothetical protein HOH55_02565 [Candidatus Marinimicrobia bacterium]|jgi:hypothetical protein|nr:hypothetical protein [Candidatus Neomarinimicrobiota bacterium]